MTREGLVRLRQRSLHLARRTKEPTAVVRSLLAVQSQDYGPAKWSIASRTLGAREPEVERLLADGTILRTHVLRPTWHLVAAEDIAWLLDLTGPRVLASMNSRYRDLGLEDGDLSKSDRLIRRSLRGGEQLTRKELDSMLERSGVWTEGQRLPHILMHSELRGTICSGVPQGRTQTYALLEDRAPNARTLARDDALAELVARFFSSHGPATPKDLRWWSSLTLADIRAGIEVVGKGLRTEVVGDRTYLRIPGAMPRRGTPQVRLLHTYDEYIVGYSESRDLAHDPDSPKRAAVGDFSPLVILNGSIVGRWKRQIRGGRLGVSIVLQRELSAAATKALEDEIARLGRFHGLEPEPTITEEPD